MNSLQTRQTLPSVFCTEGCQLKNPTSLKNVFSHPTLNLEVVPNFGCSICVYRIQLYDLGVCFTSDPIVDIQFEVTVEIDCHHSGLLFLHCYSQGFLMQSLLPH